MTIDLRVRIGSHIKQEEAEELKNEMIDLILEQYGEDIVVLVNGEILSEVSVEEEEKV